MNKQFHIMVIGERGKIRRFPCSRKKVASLLIGIFCLVTFLVTGTIFSYSLFTKNKEISQRLVSLESQVKYSKAALAKNKQFTDEERTRLNLQITTLKLDNAKQEMLHREERDRLLSTAVSELEERSKIMGVIFENIGIKVSEDAESDSEHSGGPYIPAKAEAHDDLLYKADAYLATIRHLPLGQPVNGPITSGFGRRIDPINKKRSFHEGVDIKGKRGEKIYAPADGIVTRACRNGGFGNYVEINHSHGYSTAYGHLQNYVVTKGDRVTRGQLIGQIGSTGRSTGPHLHYEIRHNRKPINPTKYLQVAKLLKKAAKAKKK